MTAHNTKASAKALLKGFWLRAITAVMLILAISATASIVAEMVMNITQPPVDVEANVFEAPISYAILLFGAAAGTFLSAPVFQGFRYVLWQRADDQNPSLAEVFYLFGSGKQLFKYTAMYIIRSVMTWLPSVAVVTPAILFLYATQNHINDELTQMPLLFLLSAVGSLMLLMLGLGLALFQSLRYMLSDYVFIKHSDKSVGFCLRLSSRLCLKHALSLIGLWFSFFPWFLLNSTGFARLFTIPYYNAALTCAAKQIFALQEDEAVEDTVTFDRATEGEQI